MNDFDDEEDGHDDSEATRRLTAATKEPKNLSGDEKSPKHPQMHLCSFAIIVAMNNNKLQPWLVF